ncbi:DEAD/DEAH box helicase [Thermococcus gammatolerans]|uniref:Hef, Helicase-associated endonuclease for fork-structured DNA (Hef) n=1 Tax=Thermococcus gammatolerans (strain DSM 15229 / JCM 11827 / EJ3) TaxID=593117 RepID=C5A607_THEGJ|nr:DEAD/DEAH box helicase [Thermococcus gammatolerans]ACS33669.1 Hef, Helicase-associated endonuclease for fork-structured DNA (Hef) [Thermococcus gammatolerans EJ3]
MSYLRRDLIEPRVYQEVIYARCKERNCLVVLPTGLGKTLIAMLIADYRLSKYGGKVLFLAPTKPLAMQHAESFRRLFNLPPEKINVLTGELSPEKRAELWRKSVVVTATPQTVENDILTGRISLEDVVLLVVDEAHRAVGNYAYVFIAREYLKTAKHPLVLGLTASPGSDEEKIREIVENLGIERIEVRTESSPDVKPYVHRIAFEWVRVELPGIYREVRKILREMLKDSLKPLADAGLVSSPSPDISKKEVLQAGSKINQAMAKGDYSAGYLKKHQAKAMKLHHAIELLETQGLTALRNYLKKLREDRSKSSRELMEDPRMRKVIYLLVQAKELGLDHPKMEKLKDLIKKQLERKPDSKIIVFTNYRDTGKKIVEELRNLGVSAERFIGQASRGTDRGMSQKEQKEVLDRFSRGEFNVLVATSVGEEGLDVPEVDLVVFYEPVPSAIRSIQRRGRTGRHRPGKVVILMAKGTRDEAYYWSSRRKEKGMFDAIKRVARELEKAQQKRGKIRERTKERVEMPSRSKITSLDAFLKVGKAKKAGGEVKETKESEKKNESQTPQIQEKRTAENRDKEIPIKPIFVKKPKGIVIYVDSRELRSGVPKILKELGAEIEVKTLDVADYVVSEEVGIERKSANDFIQSIIDGRLFDQVERLKRAYEKPVIIIEGELYGIRNVHPNAIRGAIASVTVDWGVPVLFSSGKEETAQFIYLLAKREQEERKKEVRLRSEKKALTLAERQRLIVEGLPNVSSTLAKRLLRHFGNVEKVFTATEEELKEVEGIGEKKAREIRKVITAPYVEDEG